MHFCFLSCVRAKTAVLKAALGKLLRDRRGAHVGFSERIDTMGQIGGGGGGGGGWRGGRRFGSNAKHWFTTSFLQLLTAIIDYDILPSATVIVY